MVDVIMSARQIGNESLFFSFTFLKFYSFVASSVGSLQGNSVKKLTFMLRDMSF